MTTPDFSHELLADIEAGAALALKIHNEVIAPANPSFETRMFAIAVLAAEFAVTQSDTLAQAADTVDAIAEAARTALNAAFEEKTRWKEMH
jgi:hypothetical protein